MVVRKTNMRRIEGVGGKVGKQTTEVSNEEDPRSDTVTTHKWVRDKKKYRDVSQVQLSTLQCTQKLALFQTLFQGCRPNINQSLDGAENNETLDTTSFSYR